MTFNHVKGFDQNKTIHMVNIIFLWDMIYNYYMHHDIWLVLNDTPPQFPGGTF